MQSSCLKKLEECFLILRHNNKMNLLYTINIYHDSERSGLWCARKIYEDESRGVPYCFGESSDVVLFKLENDGEDRNNIFVEVT